MLEPWSRYDLETRSNGRITGMCATNDNRDDGSCSESEAWEVSYGDRAHALRATGGSHYGFAGHQVDVYLDGVLINEIGRPVPLAVRHAR